MRDIGCLDGVGRWRCSTNNTVRAGYAGPARLDEYDFILHDVNHKSDNHRRTGGKRDHFAARSAAYAPKPADACYGDMRIQ